MLDRVESLNAALFTALVWPFRTAISFPLSTSQMRAVLSPSQRNLAQGIR